MIHHWKAIDMAITDSEYHHESTCCWVSGAANTIGERQCQRRERAGEWAKRSNERGYCRIISVARTIARVTGSIRKILYYCRESERKLLSVVKTALGFNFIAKANIPSLYEGQSFNQREQLTFFKKVNTVPEVTKL